MLSSSLETLLKVSKTTSTIKLFVHDWVTLYTLHGNTRPPTSISYIKVVTLSAGWGWAFKIEVNWRPGWSSPIGCLRRGYQYCRQKNKDESSIGAVTTYVSSKEWWKGKGSLKKVGNREPNAPKNSWIGESIIKNVAILSKNLKLCRCRCE